MNHEQTRILIVDDEQDILEFLSYNLKKEGFTVFTADNGTDGLELAKKEKPQLILLDVMMPGIAFLTARSEDYSQIAGFDAGADDYISKPIRPRVLISRIKALLRRAGNENSVDETNLGDLKIDRDKYLVYKSGHEISLPRKEFELLSLLASKPGKVFPREEILNRVWGDDVVVGDRTIDVHVRKIREKIGEECIKTVKGVGYRFEF
jgi:two-component system, OmpR family, alkaline phosphatase synthesis response regulator PhoP